MSEWRTTYTVAKAFRLGARTFRRGEVVKEGDPVIERVLAERPDFLRMRVARVSLVRSDSPRWEGLTGHPDLRRPTPVHHPGPCE